MKKIILLSAILTTLSSTFAFSKVEIDNSISAPYLAFYGSEPSGNQPRSSVYGSEPQSHHHQPQSYDYSSEPH